MTTPDHLPGFQQQLQQVWRAEKMLTEALPGIIEKAEAFGLRKNMSHHYAETLQHKTALEAIAKALDFVLEDGENEAMKTILAQGNETISAAKGDVDAAILEAAISVEEYEIAAYNAVANAALEAGYEGFSKRLRLTQAEEIQAKTKLEFMQKELPYKEAQALSI